MKFPGRDRELSLTQQHLFLRANPIVDGAGVLSHTGLIWGFSVQPTPLSRVYTARLEYKMAGSPNVFIDEPDITMLAQGRTIPHVYRNPLRLCLFLPGSGQWDHGKRLDQTIVPWTFTWLYYFEEWLSSDVWQGGGVHPNEEDDGQLNRHLRRSVAANSN